MASCCWSFINLMRFLNFLNKKYAKARTARKIIKAIMYGIALLILSEVVHSTSIISALTTSSFSPPVLVGNFWI